MTIKQLEIHANNIRQNVIKMLVAAGSGHSAGPLDLADIFAALYLEIANYNPADSRDPDRDIILLSNGHCCPVQYAAMAEAGLIPVEELMTLRKFGSRLQGHPEREKLEWLETTSGPLGSGLSQASGMAYAIKNLNKQKNRWVYCVTGDGELDEGNNWEAIMFAAKYNLHNLIVTVDRNNIQIDGNTEDVMPLESLRAKWEAFNWHVIEVDGNNIESYIDACAEARAVTEKPSVIIAHTIPGKGVDFMEYDYLWHGKPPDAAQGKLALEKLRTLNGRIEASA